MRKLYVVLAIFSFNLGFTQKIEIDSSRVKYLDVDIVTKKLLKSYDEVVKFSYEKDSLIIHCGNTYDEFQRSIIRTKLSIFLEKYSFLLNDINELNLKKADLKNVHWIQNRFKQKNKRFILKGKNLQDYKSWRVRDQMLILVIVDKINEITEFVRLQILFPKENKEIIRDYKVYKNLNRWQYGPL